MRPASIASALSQPLSTDCKPNSPKLTKLPREALPLTFPRWLFRNFTRLGISAIAGLLGLGIIAFMNPNFDADVALGGLGLGEPVIDVGPQGRQRDAAVHRALRPRHLRPAQPARKLHAHALGAPFHGLI